MGSIHSAPPVEWVPIAATFAARVGVHYSRMDATDVVKVCRVPVMVVVSVARVDAKFARSVVSNCVPVAENFMDAARVAVDVFLIAQLLNTGRQFCKLYFEAYCHQENPPQYIQRRKRDDWARNTSTITKSNPRKSTPIPRSH
jgi:hypothetical protein